MQSMLPFSAILLVRRPGAQTCGAANDKAFEWHGSSARMTDSHLYINPTLCKLV